MTSTPTPARRLRLSHVLFLALLLSGIVPLLVSNVLLVRQTRDRLKDDERTQLTQAADMLSKAVSERFEQTRRDLERVGLDVLLSAGPEGVTERLLAAGFVPYLERVHVRQGGSGLLALAVLGEGGTGPDVAQPLRLPPDAGTVRQEAFHRAYQSRRPAYALLASTAAGENPIAVVAVPVREGNQVVVVEGLVRLPVLDLLARGGAAQETAVFLLDGEERVLWSEEAPGNGQAELRGSGLIARIAGSPGALTTEYEAPAAGGKARQMLAQVSPVADLGWRLVVQKPAAQAFAAVDRLVFNALAATALLLGLTFAAAMFAARWVSRPIQKLVDASHDIAEGNFGQRVEISPGLPREVAELARDFNRMSGHVEGYVERLRQAAQANRELFIGSIRAFAAAIDAKDPYTRGHSERVAALSRIISRHLGQPEDFQQRVWIAALLHDVGKIGVEDRILRKEGGLTAEEFELMKSHTVIGAEIVSSLEPLREMVPAIRWHHEAWNGRGYPDGKRGEQIPLIARIVAVADTFDAITTNRPYQVAYTLDEAIDTLRRLAGSRFDAKVVTAFLRGHEAGEIRLPDPGPAPASIAQERLTEALT